jgi:hypothetical protein
MGLLRKAGVLHWTRPGLILVLQACQRGHQKPVHLGYNGVLPQIPGNSCPHLERLNRPWITASCRSARWCTSTDKHLPIGRHS